MIFRRLNFSGPSICGSHLEKDHALDRWIDLKSLAQELKKRLKVLHLSFVSFAVQAAVLLFFEPFRVVVLGFSRSHGNLLLSPGTVHYNIFVSLF